MFGEVGLCLMEYRFVQLLNSYTEEAVWGSAFLNSLCCCVYHRAGINLYYTARSVKLSCHFLLYLNVF